MKPPLRTVCALFLCSVTCYAGQTGVSNQKVPPVSDTFRAAAPNVPVSTAPQDTKSAVAADDTNGIKPGCETEKPPSLEDASVKHYVIGPLDVLDVRVWKDPNLSGTFDVGPDGMISLPLLGQVKADGLTLADLTHTIRTRLAASVFECAPEVNVQLLRNNSKKYFIYGGVLKQGEFPLNTEMTVMEAFANCGGFKDFANLKKIYILRGSKKIPFNYKDVSHGKNMEQDIKIQNGDKIFVPE